MNLHNHREDVKYLERLADNRLGLKPIAKRYQRLILAAEDGIRNYEKNKWSFDNFHSSVKRIIKDAEK
jgi:hypothetical protein